ncbi:TRAP transporter substrate-binding protein [Planococcus sp. X10-3]|uniref:TRAP transporter substrate-binding protein n=1 Tax=Planococcus sp. X10-3 TaxID=3061240 RepID=UPI003BAECB93
MKKMVKGLMGSVVLGSLLVGCSTGDEEGSGSTTEGETFDISYSTWANPGEPAFEGMERFKEIVEEETDGNVSIEIFPANQLGSTAEQMEQVRLGSIEMMSSGDPGLDEIEYLSLPYLMESNAHWMHVLESEIGEEWNEKLVEEMGVRTIGILPRGPRVISSNQAITNLDDMAGFKIRAPARDYYVQTFEALGASPTPMDFGELYSALQTGIVDGQENPLETIYAGGFHEVQDFIILSNHMYKPSFVSINDEFFNSLPEEYQQVMLDAAVESEQFTQEKLDESEQTMREEIETAGVEFIEPDIEAFREATQSVRDSLGTDVWGQEVYDQVVEMGTADLD